MLRRLALDKRERAARIIKETSGVQEVIQALSPRVHIKKLLQGLANVVQSLHEQPSSAAALTTNFRIGLYIPTVDGVYLEPYESFSVRDGDGHPFSSFSEHRERFALSNRRNPAHTVKCVQEKRTFIVSDTEKGGVEFYRGSSQRKYLRSMVAHPVFEIWHPSGETVTGALVVDTDQVGFFSEVDRPIIELILTEFAARLTLEMQFHKITPKLDGGVA